MGLKTLHARLDDIERVVADDRRGTGDGTAKQTAVPRKDLLVVATLELELDLVVDEETDTLVAALLEDGRGQALVDTANS